MPRMTNQWYIEQARESGPHWDDATVASDKVVLIRGSRVIGEETGCYVTVWIPDPPAEVDPLEVYKRETEG